MKCPSCRDEQSQERLGPVSEQPDQAGYRCAVCGRLYQAKVPSIDELVDRLDALHAKSAGLAAEQEKLVTQIAEVESQLRAARGK